MDKVMSLRTPLVALNEKEKQSPLSGPIHDDGKQSNAKHEADAGANAL